MLWSPPSCPMIQQLFIFCLESQAVDFTSLLKTCASRGQTHFGQEGGVQGLPGAGGAVWFASHLCQMKLELRSLEGG